MSDTNGDEKPLGDLGASPLGEAQAGSLQVLLTDRLKMVFNTMPSKLSYEDKKAVVLYYRSMRGKFIDAENEKLAAGPKVRNRTAPKSVAEALEAAKVSFDD